MYKKRICPLCQSKKYRVLLNMEAEKALKGSYGNHRNNADLDFDQESLFPIVKCIECSFVYSLHLLDSKYLNMIYDEVLIPENDRTYAHSFEYIKAMTGIYRLLLFSLNAASFTNREVKILDFGAGWGQFLEVAKNPKSELFGFEKSEIRKEYMTNLGIHVLHDYEDIMKNAPFDIICCNQVIEHLADPLESLKIISSVLSQGGVAWISVPHYSENILIDHINKYNHFDEKSNWDEYPFTLNPFEHLNYFSPDTFLKSLELTDLSFHLIHNYMDINSTPIYSPHIGGTEAVVKSKKYDAQN